MTTMEYVAEFVEGEGSVGFFPNGSGWHYLKVQLVQNEGTGAVRLCEQIQVTDGDSIARVRTLSDKTSLRWQANADSTVASTAPGFSSVAHPTL